MDPKRHSHVGLDTGRTYGRMLGGYYAICASRTQEGSGGGVRMMDFHPHPPVFSSFRLHYSSTRRILILNGQFITPHRTKALE
jgi:hypothetical protein